MKRNIKIMVSICIIIQILLINSIQLIANEVENTQNSNQNEISVDDYYYNQLGEDAKYYYNQILLSDLENGVINIKLQDKKTELNTNDMLRQYLISWENVSVETNSNYSEGDYYKVFPEGDNSALNVYAGIKIYEQDTKNYFNYDLFLEKGVDLKDVVSKYESTGKALISKAIVREIFDKMLNDTYRTPVERAVEGLNLTSYQIDALMCIAYHFGTESCNNLPEAYEKYGGATEEFRENWACPYIIKNPQHGPGSFYRGYNYTSESQNAYEKTRSTSEWNLFTTGKYNVSTGEVLELNYEDIAEKYINESVKPYLEDAIAAIIKDHGELYWMLNVQINTIHYTDENEYLVLDSIDLKTNQTEYINKDEFNRKIQEVCDMIEGNSTYDIVKNTSKYINENIEFKSDAIASNQIINETPYGAVINAKSGYRGEAQLVNLICRKKGIKSVVIYGKSNDGEAYMWVDIFIPESNKWYVVSPHDGYLMIGSQTVCKGTSKFEDLYKTEYKEYSDQTFIPTVPSISNSEYVETILEVDLKGNVTKEKDGVTYIEGIQPLKTANDIKSSIDTNGTIIFRDNNEVQINDLSKSIGTGTKMEIILNESKVVYTIVVAGDTNGDGKANIQDIFSMNKHRLNKVNLSGAYFEAADINEDKVVDIKDIFKLNKYRLGKIEQL